MQQDEILEDAMRYVEWIGVLLILYLTNSITSELNEIKALLKKLLDERSERNNTAETLQKIEGHLSEISSHLGDLPVRGDLTDIENSLLEIAQNTGD